VLDAALVRNSLKLAVAALITAAIAVHFGRIEFLWYPLLAVVIVVDDNDDHTVQAATGRVMGTVLGGLITFLVHTVLSGWAGVLVSLVVMVPALALAFANSASLQGQREQVAAALARFQAEMGSYWPTISAFANGGYEGSRSITTAKRANDNLGFGPQFSPSGLLTPSTPSSSAAQPGVPTAGPFYVPKGGSAGVTSGEWAVEGGLHLNYALLDFARTPTVRATRARLEQQRNTYASQLRSLQLQVSEAYYQLQRSDQLVRVYEANVRNDLVILQDSLDLKQAGLVPRLDVLRRRAIQAADEETLIQALADRAVARRQLAVLLNLPADVTPTASDPIVVQPRWPLDLEASLLAAYRGNPELEAILATRTALAQQSQATAAGLLPRLSLFASAGGGSAQTSLSDFDIGGGGCCGSTALPLSTTSGWDWSVGLAFTWLLFDAGTTAGQARALAKQEAAAAQQYAASRNDIRLRIEQAFFNHEASLAKLSSARRGVAAAVEAFRDVRLRYQTGLSSEIDLSVTQDRLISSLVQRLDATVNVNVTYARLLKELLPVPRDPSAPIQPQLQLSSASPGQP
jgi:outer membrane protein TolC